MDAAVTPAAERSLIVRAAAHVRPHSRSAQRFAPGVTNAHVADLLLFLEMGIRFYRARTGRWFTTDCIALDANVSSAVDEAIRTGLVRHWEDRNGHHLAPARVHLEGSDGRSACHFAGEDMGPMRARLVSEPEYVDCLECLEHCVRRL
jgi:hypothetical protein